MAKLVRFYEVGGPEVLKIEDIPLRQALQRGGHFACAGNRVKPCGINVHARTLSGTNALHE